MAEETYQTTNFLEALTLYLTDYNIKSVQPKGNNNSKVCFYFEKDEKLTQALSDYEKRKLKFDAQQWLKGMRDFTQTHHIEFTKFQ